LISSNGFVNSSGKEFIWRVNDRFFDKGIGLDKISFEIEEVRGFNYSISVLVRDGERDYQKSITIPVRAQDVVVEVPYPNNILKRGEEVILSSIPYFFSVESFDELEFSWSINNVSRGDQKDNNVVLDVGGDQTLVGQRVSIRSFVTNRFNPNEGAEAIKFLTIQ